MIEITEHKLDKMSGYAEELLRIGGKLMQCLEEVSNGSDYGERNSDRYEIGERGGNSGDYGERRGMRGGNYSRYR